MRSSSRLTQACSWRTGVWFGTPGLCHDRKVRPMQRPRSVAAGYLAALVCVAAALALRALFPALLEKTPYLTAYLAILATARYFGTRPAILATIAGAAGCTVLAGTLDWPRLLL